MAIDRAKNTLRQARLLRLGRTVQDAVGSGDRDDLYRVRLDSRSQFSFSLRSSTKLSAELFALKDGALGRIGRIDFSKLNRRQIRQNLTRLASNSRSIDPTRASSFSSQISRTLDGGVYYLNISAGRGNNRYRLTVNATPIPNPRPSPTPDPSPSPTMLTRSWLQQFGTSGNDSAYGIAIDPSGNNIYISGTTPAVSDAERTDSFVTQYDSSGSVVGSLRRFGSADDDAAFGIAIDAAGNYSVGGITNLFIDRADALNSRLDGSLTQFNSSGTQNWQALVESTISIPILGNRPAGDAVSSVAIDAAGNLYIAGFTGESLSDLAQAFVAKYKPNGDREWLTRYGTSRADAASGVALDAAGNVYITGVTRAQLNLNSANNFDGLFTEGDAFVAKFDSSGVFQWDETLGTPSQPRIQDYARAIAVTAEGTIYISGQTDGALPGQTSAGGRDAFIARYSTDGTLGWVKQFGTSSLDEAQGIAIAPDGSVYLSGETNAALSGQTHAGGSDAFFAQFAPNGDRLTVQQFGTAQNDESYNLRFDAAGNLYVIGQTEGAFAGQTSAGQYDVFVAKYAPQ